MLKSFSSFALLTTVQLAQAQQQMPTSEAGNWMHRAKMAKDHHNSILEKQLPMNLTNDQFKSKPSAAGAMKRHQRHGAPVGKPSKKTARTVELDLIAKGWTNTRFQVRGDDQPFERRTVFEGDATEYNVHTMTVTSPVDQEITLKAAGLGARFFNSSQVLLQKSGDAKKTTRGAPQEATFKVAAGEEVEFQVYTKFQDDSKLPRDWSVVAWAEREPVTIAHKGGLVSSEAPANRKLDHDEGQGGDPFQPLEPAEPTSVQDIMDYDIEVMLYLLNTEEAGKLTEDDEWYLDYILGIYGLKQVDRKDLQLQIQNELLNRGIEYNPDQFTIEPETSGNGGWEGHPIDVLSEKQIHILYRTYEIINELFEKYYNGQQLSGQEMFEFSALKINFTAMQKLLEREDQTFDEFADWVFAHFSSGWVPNNPGTDPVEPWDPNSPVEPVGPVEPWEPTVAPTLSVEQVNSLVGSIVALNKMRSRHSAGERLNGEDMAKYAAVKINIRAMRKMLQQDFMSEAEFIESWSAIAGIEEIPVVVPLPVVERPFKFDKLVESPPSNESFYALRLEDTESKISYLETIIPGYANHYQRITLDNGDRRVNMQAEPAFQSSSFDEGEYTYWAMLDEQWFEFICQYEERCEKEFDIQGWNLKSTMDLSSNNLDVNKNIRLQVTAQDEQFFSGGFSFETEIDTFNQSWSRAIYSGDESVFEKTWSYKDRSEPARSLQFETERSFWIFNDELYTAYDSQTGKYMLFNIAKDDFSVLIEDYEEPQFLTCDKANTEKDNCEAEIQIGKDIYSIQQNGSDSCLRIKDAESKKTLDSYCYNVATDTLVEEHDGKKEEYVLWKKEMTQVEVNDRSGNAGLVYYVDLEVEGQRDMKIIGGVNEDNTMVLDFVLPNKLWEQLSLEQKSDKKIDRMEFTDQKGNPITIACRKNKNCKGTESTINSSWSVDYDFNYDVGTILSANITSESGQIFAMTIDKDNQVLDTLFMVESEGKLSKAIPAEFKEGKNEVLYRKTFNYMNPSQLNSFSLEDTTSFDTENGSYRVEETALVYPDVLTNYTIAGFAPNADEADTDLNIVYNSIPVFDDALQTQPPAHVNLFINAYGQELNIGCEIPNFFKPSVDLSKLTKNQRQSLNKTIDRLESNSTEPIEMAELAALTINVDALRELIGADTQWTRDEFINAAKSELGLARACKDEKDFGWGMAWLSADFNGQHLTIGRWGEENVIEKLVHHLSYENWTLKRGLESRDSQDMKWKTWNVKEAPIRREWTADVKIEEKDETSTYLSSINFVDQNTDDTIYMQDSISTFNQTTMHQKMEVFLGDAGVVFSQIIRQNETDRFYALQHEDGSARTTSTSNDINLKLEEGFGSFEFETSQKFNESGDWTVKVQNSINKENPDQLEQLISIKSKITLAVDSTNSTTTDTTTTTNTSETNATTTNTNTTTDATTTETTDTTTTTTTNTTDVRLLQTEKAQDTTSKPIKINFCVKQTIDFGTSQWSRQVFDLDCENMVLESTWNFTTGEGQIYPVTEGPSLEELRVQAYDSAYATAYPTGLEQAAFDAIKGEDLTDYQREKQVNAFPAWVQDQEQNTHYFTCDSEIRIDHPDFVRDSEVSWSFWASQDCSDYDLVLTVLLDQKTYNNYLTDNGAETTADTCKEDQYLGKAVYSCEYELKAGSENFGILFSGEFNPVFYSQKWRQNSTWAPLIDWWNSFN